MDSQFVVAFVVLLTISTLPLRTAQDINSAGCGTSKFCASEPATCDPSMAGSCFFVSAVSSGGQTFSFQLSGQSTGYIALGLSVDANPGGDANYGYVCDKNNNSVQVSSFRLKNNALTSNPTSLANLTQGSVNGSSIQCTFSATVPNDTASTNFFLFIFSGTSTNGTLGSPNMVFRSASAVDVSNPTITTTSTLTANSTSSTSSNATSRNARSSNATATNPTSTNPTSRNATASNATSSNPTSTSTTSTNPTSRNATASYATSSNATTSNATATNPTSTNPTSTSTTSTNPTSTSTTSTSTTSTNPTSTSTTSTNPTLLNSTPGPIMTTTSAGPHLHSLSRALLIVLGVLGLAML